MSGNQALLQYLLAVLSSFLCADAGVPTVCMACSLLSCLPDQLPPGIPPDVVDIRVQQPRKLLEGLLDPPELLAKACRSALSKVRACEVVCTCFPGEILSIGQTGLGRPCKTL